MAFIKKLGYFAAPALVVAMGSLAATGCDAEDLGCGPCGSVVTGDVGISGNAKLDGFFAAVSQLNNATVSASGDFELGLSNLEAAWGITAEANASLDDRVDEILLAIKGDFGASAEASLFIKVAPAMCSANVDIAIEAQANCEAKAGCEGEVDPGSVEVVCEGECTGSCEGGCAADVEVMCEIDAGGVACEGSCEGTCELDASLDCSGTCVGECDGECSVVNADGSCNGSCEGECNGTCEVSGGAECSGSCHGSCVIEEPEGGCEASAEVKCEGKCEGTCSGGCTGEATPPSARVDCEASADCNAQASAQGSASLECTPPSIEWGVDFGADASASVQAELGAKLAALRANAGVMLGSTTKLQALFTGEVNGEVAFEVAPVDAVAASLEGVISAGVDGELFADIPAGRITCVIPAMKEAASLIVSVGEEGAAAVSAQGKFAASLSTGFSN